ncbi:MAG TPA: extracellular solute-binding protein [Chloroflexota bacterium]|nr:extracellular solute-binding protein [Chloroflexota bacterium]
MALKLSRRRLLVIGASAAFVTPILAACASTPPTPTTAPKPAGAAGAAPTQAAAPAAKPATSAQKVSIRFMRFAGAGWEQDVEFIDEFQKANPNIEVVPEDTPYGEANKKILTLGATGTLADVFPGHTRWNGVIRFKGLMLDLDPMVKSFPEITKFDDFFPSIIADVRGPGADGKLFELPTVVHPGGNAVVLINLEHAEKAGAKIPANSDWTIQQLEELARTAARPKENVYGTQITFTSPLYSTQATRSWGGSAAKSDPAAWVLSPDGKKSQLGSPLVKEAFEWYRKMIADGIVPTSDVAPAGSGQNYFTAGMLATNSRETGAVQANSHIIQEKFKWKAVLWPKGALGHRGSCLSYNTMACYSKSPNPEAAYKLLVNQTSEEVGLWAGYEGKANPYGRRSVWSNPKLHERYPIMKDVSEWFQQEIDPFPMPWNLLAQEYQDAFGQEIAKYLDGKETWDEMYPRTQKALQDILDQPRA